MLIIWGAGTLGRLVGAQWDGRVIGYTKSETNHHLLKKIGIEPHIGSPVETVTADTHLLLALPGHARQLDAIQQLAAHNVVPKRVVLISSTGFYGAQSGRLGPNSPAGTPNRAQAIADMEQQFQAWAGARGVILRPGGLYNAERGPFVAFKRRGTLPDKPMNRTLALIHYADVATATYNALVHPNPESVYVAVTPPTPLRGDFYQAAITHLGLDLTVNREGMEEGAADIVTYDITTLRRDLLPTPRYPDWHTIFKHSNK